MSGLREVWPFVDAHHQAGRPVALARLVGRDGPGARPIGATLAAAVDGTWRGSLSGGCVEGIVLEHTRRILGGASSGIVPISPGGDLLPWEPTPACAGELQVLITPAPPAPVHSAITRAVSQDQSLVLSVRLGEPYTWAVGEQDGHTFAERIEPRRRLVLVGATDLAATLAALASTLDRRVIILDPRLGHLRSGAFAPPTELVQVWPERWLREHPLAQTDALVVLTHDPRIDDRALRAALPGLARYVAALGSRATHAHRLQRLTGTPGLDRLAGPAGLDLGGMTIGDTALSIIAELVAVENGRAGHRLRDGDLPIRAGDPGRAV